MKRWLWVLGITAVIAIIAFVLTNAQVNLSLEEHTERSLKVETSFPNASCSKTLSHNFPFAIIRCEEAPPLAKGAGDEPESEIALPKVILFPFTLLIK